MKRNILSVLVALTSLSLISCGGGDDDGDSSGGVSENACPVIGLNAKIINGTECEGEEQSPVVRILIVDRASNTQALCSGAMISSTAVLTAAHCFGNPQSELTIVDVAGRSFTARSVAIHPNFRRERSTFGDSLVNDVAIIKLASSPGLPTLPLATSVAVAPNDIISIFGYGLNEDDEAGELQSGQGRVEDVSSEHILELYDGDGSNTCQGDSGGPAIIQINGLPAIAGVTSTGTVDGCGKGDISLYTNLQNSSNAGFVRAQVPDVGGR